MSLTLYTLLLRLLMPLALLRLYWRGLRVPAYRERIAERLACGRSAAPAADCWIHAVSVGEVQAAVPVIKHLLAAEPPLGVLVTTTTPTGAQRVRTLLGDRVTHRYMPFDLPEMIARFLDQVRPRLVLVMETEIWPNMLDQCARRAIPVILANARLSERSARGYRRLGRLTGETLRRFDRIAVQTEAEAGRFAALGADPSRVRVTGSIKFDQRPAANIRERAEAFRRLWGGERPVWVAASTHEGEETQLLAAHRLLRQQVPDALLVLVPRHPERFDRVAGLVQREGLAMVRRSAGMPCGAQTAIFLGDSMGELAAFLAAAQAAFIGGSLVPVGGHNLLEAAAVGVPAITGPHVFNFSAIAELLVDREAAVVVDGPEPLARVLGHWLADAAERARIGENGRRVIEENRGALGRLLALIDSRLGQGNADLGSVQEQLAQPPR